MDQNFKVKPNTLKVLHKSIRETLEDLEYDSDCPESKSKNGQMELHKIFKILLLKGNNYHNEGTAYRM
jgi:hypothetical protein